MKQASITRIRDNILLQALPEIVFDGWTWDVATRAAVAAGYDRAMARSVFPGGVTDFISHFSDWADREMLDSLRGIDPGSLRVRERIHAGVMARIKALSPWREAERRAMTYWAVPLRNLQASRNLWRTADRIWVWAGDTASDYNHYSKRILLSGVIGATMLAWLNDESGDPEKIAAFLDRRIENVLKMGKIIGKLKKGA